MVIVGLVDIEATIIVGLAGLSLLHLHQLEGIMYSIVGLSAMKDSLIQTDSLFSVSFLGTTLTTITQIRETFLVDLLAFICLAAKKKNNLSR